MLKTRILLSLGLLLAIAACGGTAARYTTPSPAIADKIGIAFASVEVRDVSLPTYAAADEIHIQDADGTLVSSPDILWADAPERAVALELSRNLTRLTGRRIAAEPWPFESFPDARLEIRFTDLLATSAGQFRASGQYYVGVPDGGRERSGLFEEVVVFDPAGGPTAIATARSQLILNLATQIAREGLR
ncbi:MAG: ABC-type transport auxiliary lipoprotein family protein [Sulfitobacter sp.]|nr:ABC-type transport auxiliary lipoprotein family protein [Sulfitobacter sp.]